jgi:hypothetical protein
MRKRRSNKELTEEWNKEHPEQAANIILRMYDLSDKQPKIKCPACNTKMIWTKAGRMCFCHKCYTWVHFSSEGYEEVYKKHHR